MDIFQKLYEIENETGGDVSGIKKLIEDGQVTIASSMPSPDPKDSVREIEMFNRFNKDYPNYADGGMLVKPSSDGSRPGYQGPKISFTPKELENIFKGVENKEYAYKCKTSIARMHCVSSECVKRKLGIGTNEAIPEVGKLIKVNSYPEPYWILPIQGKSIRLSTKQLYQQQLLGEQLLN